VHNADALVAILDPMFASQPLAYWKKVLDEGRVIFGVVQIAEEIIGDPQMRQNSIFLSLDHAGMPGGFTVGSPIQIATHEKVAPSRAPALGEHSAEVLSELGFSADDVRDMFVGGVVSKPAVPGV
jgi:formyl-CoA transferase